MFAVDSIDYSKDNLKYICIRSEVNLQGWNFRGDVH